MERSYILHMFTPGKQMSPFDINMAVDAGYQVVVPYCGVTLDEITGGSPSGAGTLAGSDGKRQPTENELSIARYQGAHVANLAKRLTWKRLFILELFCDFQVEAPISEHSQIPELIYLD